jgi:hypothetical protein
MSSKLYLVYEHCVQTQKKPDIAVMFLERFPYEVATMNVVKTRTLQSYLHELRGTRHHPHYVHFRTENGLLSYVDIPIFQVDYSYSIRP